MGHMFRATPCINYTSLYFAARVGETIDPIAPSTPASPYGAKGSRGWGQNYFHPKEVTRLRAASQVRYLLALARAGWVGVRECAAVEFLALPLPLNGGSQ
jgi:hypothetical protein